MQKKDALTITHLAAADPAHFLFIHSIQKIILIKSSF